VRAPVNANKKGESRESSKKLSRTHTKGEEKRREERGREESESESVGFESFFVSHALSLFLIFLFFAGRPVVVVVVAPRAHARGRERAFYYPKLLSSRTHPPRSKHAHHSRASKIDPPPRAKNNALLVVVVVVAPFSRARNIKKNISE
jgi:hypothetical protein